MEKKNEKNKINVQTSSQKEYNEWRGTSYSW